MGSEKEYLAHAINRQKLVVIVQKIVFSEYSMRRKIEYVSDNADIFGMSSAAMKNGLRLPVDYVHPDDRDDFAGALHMAMDTGADFNYVCRIVGDDGRLYKVDVAVSFISRMENEAVLEFVYRDASVRTETLAVSDMEAVPDKASGDMAKVIDVLKENNLAEFFQNISCAFDLYSTIVDNKGRILVRPVGPEGYLGDFYDLFERPQYRKFFEDIKKRITENNKPYMTDMGQYSPDSRISAAPIYVEGEHVATWLLCAYDKKQAENLANVYEKQWNIADNVSTYMKKINISIQKAEKLKKLEEDIESKIREKEIISDAIMGLSEGVTGVSNLFRSVGEAMNLDYIVMFGLMSNTSDIFEYKKGWFREKRDREIMGVTWTRGRYGDEGNIIKEKGALIIDHNNMTNRIRVGIFLGKVRAVMIYPVIIDDVVVAYIAFCENTRERVWSQNEIGFAKDVSNVVTRILRFTDAEEASDNANKELIDIFNYFKDGIFVKEDETGKVLFSNRILNKMLGYDFTGKDSTLLISSSNRATDFSDNYNKGKVTNWRKYLDTLVKVVDITEVKVKWLSGEPVTVYIIKPVEN
ncbi:PAS fold-containing protein [Eubacterium ruminantium]|nr:PAS fold-containing protein [Eubacterium ruminantium]